MIKAVIIILSSALSAATGFVCQHSACVHRCNALMMKCNDDVLKLSSAQDADAIDRSRRDLILGTIVLPPLWTINADISSAAKLRPDDAYANLVKAREELNVAGEKFVSKRDWEGLRTYLSDEAVNMNNYESNAQALLESKRLDAESKKDIGTIRRYGVGADVIIMYGGLKNEIDEGNESTSASEVAKYLRRTSDSLDEVLAICRSNGFN